MAQVWDAQAGSLVEPNGPAALGPANVHRNQVRVLNSPKTPVFHFFDAWLQPAPEADRQAAFRASVARGNDIFLNRRFWVKDVAHINSIGLANPAKRTCAVCHNAQMSGMDIAPGLGGPRHHELSDVDGSQGVERGRRPAGVQADVQGRCAAASVSRPGHLHVGSRAGRS